MKQAWPGDCPAVLLSFRRKKNRWPVPILCFCCVPHTCAVAVELLYSCICTTYLFILQVPMLLCGICSCFFRRCAYRILGCVIGIRVWFWYCSTGNNAESLTDGGLLKVIAHLNISTQQPGQESTEDLRNRGRYGLSFVLVRATIVDGENVVFCAVDPVACGAHRSRARFSIPHC